VAAALRVGVSVGELELVPVPHGEAEEERE